MSAPVRGGAPDEDALAALTGRARLQKAAPTDPVLGVASAPQPAGPTFFPGSDPVQAGRDAADALAAEPVERKEKVGGWYGYPSNLARIRAAWFHTQTKEDGWPSISEMTEQLLLAEAERLEEVHNGGEPFPAVPAGKVRRSRRHT